MVIYGYMSLLTALCCCQEDVIRALGWATSPQLYENVLLCRAMWRIYEIIHIWTAVVDESEVWSSQ